MTAEFAAQLRTRAEAAAVVIPPELLQQLSIYYDLLQRWNRKLNLTSLSNPDRAIDRLILEPLAAAQYLPGGSKLVDLGSGGGSPAIPLALALRTTALLMVESRSRKAAFLREAAREVGIAAAVEAARFEEIAHRPPYSGVFDVVSIRAVRLERATLTSAAAFLRPGGLVALFRGVDSPDRLEIANKNLAWRESRPLLRSSEAHLTLLFHVEHHK